MNLTKAENAKDRLLEKFNSAALKSLPVIGAGITLDEGRYAISVYLERPFTEVEKALAPKQFEGTRVNYEILGQIKPQR